MKRIIFFAAAALAALVGCKRQGSAEILASFGKDVEASANAYFEGLRAVEADSTLTDEQREVKYEALEDEMFKKAVGEGVRIIKKNPADAEVVPSVLRDIYPFMEKVMDGEELDALLGSLGEAVRQDKFVASLIGSRAAKKATAVGCKFTDFTVDHVSGLDKDGNPVYEKKSLSDFVGKGKVMLVDFWSPWCPPCRAELPNVKAVWEKYHGDDFDVLSVAVWEESRKMDWRNTIDTAAVYGVTWSQLNNGHSEPASLYGIDGIPHMILFDKDGTILKRGDDLRGENIEKSVAEVLGR